MKLLSALAFAAALATSLAFAQPASAPAPILDGAAIVGPPPAAGSPAAAADRLAFRPAISEARLAQARADQPFDPFVALRPALGERFTATALPRTKKVFDDVLVALGPGIGAGKDAYARRRPYLDDARILQCDIPAASGADSPSYPSGHGAGGWAWALVMAELLPAHADAILVRGRDYGDSRVICGFHYPSDIESGRILAAGTIARLHADPAFRRDLDAARRELRRFTIVRANAP
ncbi:MAG: phosphatase PAP2 family protein [Hyphomonadaceae bacterium]|nr:phosphatase PAP2 family protein [Hyphomonadaceae bacterium]